MSTPPAYPFRSRREIHSGEPKVYSDAHLEEQASTTEPTPAPDRGKQPEEAEALDPDKTPVRGTRLTRQPSDVLTFDDVTDAPQPSRGQARRHRRSAGAKLRDGASETTGMRSRRLAAERRAARKRKRRARIRSFLVLFLVLGLVSGAGYLAYTQLVSSSATSSDDFPGPGSGSVEVTIDEEATGRQIGQTLVDAGVVKSVGAFVRQFETNRAAMSIRPGTYRQGADRQHHGGCRVRGERRVR